MFRLGLTLPEMGNTLLCTIHDKIIKKGKPKYIVLIITAYVVLRKH